MLSNRGACCIAVRRDPNLVKFGVFYQLFIIGEFKKIGIAALPLRLNPHYVETFPEGWFTDLVESVL